MEPQNQQLSTVNYQLKVCGLKKLNQIQELIDLNVDFLGFIFYEKSPRYVLNHLTFKQIKNIKHQGKVGVFVNEDLEKVIDIIEKTDIQYIQLHGDEDEDFISELKDRLMDTIKIIKVVRIPFVIPTKEESQRFFTSLRSVQNDIDYILFDTDSQSFGGTGTSFDWTILNEMAIPVPYFLSGGISLKDIENLQNFVKVNLRENKTLTKFKPPFALDINSKFEIEPGNKDVEKVKEFLSLIKNEKSPI